LGTTNTKSLLEHSENKHPKNSFEECFPELGGSKEEEEVEKEDE
jgi:hypothetical protein